MSVRVKGGTTLFLMLLLSLSLGCGASGPERTEVQGTVSFDGTPVESGSIAFIPSEGTVGPSTGGSIIAGTYHLASGEGPVIGPHRVEIRAMRNTGQQVKAGEGADDPEALVDDIEMFSPATFNSQSTLTADIQSGTNELDFDLKSSAN